MAATRTDADTLGPGKLPGDLLGRLLGTLGAPDPAVIAGPGIGRDAAAIDLGSTILVLKTDPITFAAEGAAASLVEVNANDLACLGATPRWMLVTALLPDGVAISTVEQLFADLGAATARRGIALVGGHTEVTPGIDRPLLVGMLAGVAERAAYLPPGGARAGDLLVISGAIPVEGTALLASDRAAWLRGRVGSDVVTEAQRYYESPGISVVDAARVALAAGGITALHDPTEGGLAMGVREIAAASCLGVELDADAVPLLGATDAIARAFGIDPLGMLASGSLLAAVDPGRVAGVLNALRAAGHSPAIVGRLIADPAEAWLLDGDDRHHLPDFTRDEVSRALEETAG
jgi:hydrogenase expression/formation protein HypE